MTRDARDSPSIQRLLERVPEFKPRFDQFIADVGESGSFWAINELHRWVFPQDDPELLRRVFAAVDELYADQTLPDGDILAIEFFEAVREAGRGPYDGYIGTASREWFDRFG